MLLAEEGALNKRTSLNTNFYSPWPPLKKNCIGCSSLLSESALGSTASAHAADPDAQLRNTPARSPRWCACRSWWGRRWASWGARSTAPWRCAVSSPASPVCRPVRRWRRRPPWDRHLRRPRRAGPRPRGARRGVRGAAASWHPRRHRRRSPALEQSEGRGLDFFGGWKFLGWEKLGVKMARRATQRRK